MSTHRDAEYRLIMGVICGVCAIGPLGAVFPLVEHVAGVGFGVLFGMLALAGLVYTGREARRELLFRAEMRALDRRDAARQNASALPVVRAAGGGRR